MLHGLERLSGLVGVTLSEDAARLMRRYWKLVLETNEHTNLTRITADREAVLKHFVDCLTLLGTGLIGPGARVVDVGAGAGFPGIPLKIARPDVGLLLVDSTLKRVRFLRDAAAALALKDVEAIHGRAEQIGADARYAGTFDVATARAVARLDRLVGWCLPFVKPGGHFIAMKGPDVEEEVAEAEAALKAAGGRVAGLERLTLPEGAGERTLVVVAKG